MHYKGCFEVVGKGRNSYSKTDVEAAFTLIPVLGIRKPLGGHVGEVIADSGYCSEKNLLFLKEKGIAGYIKLQDHEKRKTRRTSESTTT